MEIPKIKSYSVSEITKTIKAILTEKKELKNIWVRGEISNLSNSATGHIYFSLKDEFSILPCVFFSFNKTHYKGKKLQNGMEIGILGNIAVYETGGYYNFNVLKIEEFGQGEILLKIEKLKQKLEELNIFDLNHKKPIPKFPKTLGIATSHTGAALHDIIKIAKERFPNINILIAPCVVQGTEAPKSITNAINELNNPFWKVDVIIAGRGGGSFEDLIAFNDENVVMAYYNSRVPIISAVGHEVDRVLTDLSADISAPTPTAAAKLAIPEISDVDVYIDDMEKRFMNALLSKLKILNEKLFATTNRLIFQEPKMLLVEKFQKTDQILKKIYLLGINFLSQKKSDLQQFDSMSLLVKNNFAARNNQYNLISERIENFSPLATLKRGYSVTRNNQKEVVFSAKKVKIGEELNVILFDGKLKVEVMEKND